MITNSSLTIYHLNEETQVYTRHNYSKVWFFGGKGASINKGYDNANDVEIRLPYSENDNLDIKNFSVGDIIVKGTLTNDITTQSELSNYEIYNITSIKNNNFGNSQHIHIGGK